MIKKMKKTQISLKLEKYRKSKEQYHVKEKIKYSKIRDKRQKHKNNMVTRVPPIRRIKSIENTGKAGEQVAVGRREIIRLSPGLYGGPDKTMEEENPNYT